MKKQIQYLLTTLVLFIVAGNNCFAQDKPANYIPDDPALYKTIVAMDSIFFDAYNNCNLKLEKYASMYADNIEFYHDRGGLSSVKKDIVESTRINVCGKVTRELQKGSIEVYAIPGFGAVEFGFHCFHNKLEPNAPSHMARFMIIWEQKNNDWKLSRVVSLH
ncbi:MAG: hypothetical protein B7Y15_13350 [Bacteroidetes bacterium 24-39-8]|jgi:hypothetical protein|nr:MAG: hypothetical protein B7Y76_05480 [Sphingobacteriia bacterium 35-40-5]OYZ47800.1 MAG: hypothetical protein B7Y15_13350 [Bacteroidetes bacterium 24-39-8]OZA63634.1 MAG: hypothetical protein B7X72_10085 [Sphingobacteriia bacterium 39-39-8]HQR93451.1 nuclear transport factor 2 family protein [Sediminibacterium sp.]HQS54983.1 nuclear transport factor 2 family protein [Sediminibacterium sp.]